MIKKIKSDFILSPSWNEIRKYSITFRGRNFPKVKERKEKRNTRIPSTTSLFSTPPQSSLLDLHDYRRNEIISAVKVNRAVRRGNLYGWRGAQWPCNLIPIQIMAGSEKFAAMIMTDINGARQPAPAAQFSLNKLLAGHAGGLLTRTQSS